jgi:hypothetical protein
MTISLAGAGRLWLRIIRFGNGCSIGKFNGEPAETTAMPTGAGTVAESIAENDDTHDDEEDYQWMRQMWQPLR